MDYLAEQVDARTCLGREGLNEVMRRSYVAILRSARRILRDEQVAQDVTQEVFLRALRNRESDTFIPHPAAWLHRVTVNLCLNRLRDQRRRRELVAGYVPDGWRQLPPDAAVIVREALQEIPEDLEDAVLRHYFDDESHQEIAAAMGVSRRTVGNRIAAFNEWLRVRCNDPAPSRLRVR